MEQASFELYLGKVRNLSPSTVEHYQESMRKITKVLHGLGYHTYDSLYEIDSYAELKRIESFLLRDKEFVELDERGNRMYSAGLHRYMEFAQGKGFEKLGDALSLIDKPCNVANGQHTKSTNVANRDRIIVRQVLASEHFLCESDPNHKTFTSLAYRKPYMEGHHLIPLNVQDEFSNSLDVYANIVSLCPVCHRLLHYGMEEDKKQILVRLFDERRDRLADSGIHVGRKEFLEITSQTHRTTYQ
ncbi:MAG: HNH endonuclease [Sphaerochaetaceae bacterium]|jgi:5-methylcytosine-specific restriction protein A